MNKTTLSIAVVAFIIGLALGSIAFPSTQSPKVTLTAASIAFEYLVPSCTTVSGKLFVTYRDVGGTIGITTVHSGTLPEGYLVTVTTVSTYSVTVTYITQPFVGSC